MKNITIILQEVYVTLTTKARIGVTISDARVIVQHLAAWQPVAIDFRILERAWHLTAIQCPGGMPSLSGQLKPSAARAC